MIALNLLGIIIPSESYLINRRNVIDFKRALTSFQKASTGPEFSSLERCQLNKSEKWFHGAKQRTLHWTRWAAGLTTSNYIL